MRTPRVVLFGSQKTKQGALQENYELVLNIALDLPITEQEAHGAARKHSII